MAGLSSPISVNTPVSLNSGSSKKKMDEDSVSTIMRSDDFIDKFYEDSIKTPVSSDSGSNNKKMEEDSVSTIRSYEDKENVSDDLPSEILTPDQSPISSPEAEVTPTPQQSPIMRPNRVQMSKKLRAPPSPQKKLSLAQKRKIPEFQDFEIPKKKSQQR